MAADMAGMQMGMMMGQHLAAQMNQTMGTQANGQPGDIRIRIRMAAWAARRGQRQPSRGPNASGGPNFCPNCGTRSAGQGFVRSVD